MDIIDWQFEPGDQRFGPHFITPIRVSCDLFFFEKWKNALRNPMINVISY